MAASPNRLLRICHINARSLEAHFTDVLSLISAEQLDVLAISESWLKPFTSSNLVVIEGFNIFRVDRIGKGGGGVALYVKDEIKCKPIFQSAQPNAYTKRPEFLFALLTVGPFKLLLGVVYSPPPKCGYWSDVEEALLNSNTAYDFLMLTGDLNIDFNRQSTPRNILTSFLVASNLELLPFRHTHHVGIQHSTIDYMCVSDVSRVVATHQSYQPSISQHDALIAHLEVPWYSSESRKITSRTFRSFDPVSFAKDLQSVDWGPMLRAANINDKVSYLTATITQLYDRHAPYRSFTPKKLPSPWLSCELKDLIKLRNRAWSVYRRSGRIEDHNKYKALRNRVKSSIRNAISSYYKNLFSQANGPAEMWKLVNKIGLRSKANYTTPLPGDVNEMNKYFAGDSTASPLHDLSPTVRISPDDRFYFRHVTYSEVVIAVNAAKSNPKVSDDIPISFLRECLVHIVPSLMHIYDCSLQSGVFPSLWKEAIVRPIPKCAQPREFKDFKPISILCAASKILEALASRQIEEYIRDRNFLDPFQSGFRKRHSTHTALLYVVDEIRAAIDSECLVLLVGIDLLRAFDMVNVQLLTEKLERMGFSDSACKWVHSFLSDRSQVVVGPDATSEPVIRNIGVPQGSLNGPPFYSLFTNDLPSTLRYCSHHMYADDTNIYTSGSVKDVKGVVDRVNEDLRNVARWAKMNGLLINAKKTKRFGLALVASQVSYVGLQYPL